MKSFFKYVLATITGIIISFFLLFVLLVGVITVIISSAGGDKETVVADNSILHVTLRESITERTVPNPFEDLDIPGFDVLKTLGLSDILERIAAAKNDARITGIYLDLSSVNAGRATIEEIRNALLDFKESGKFIISYSETYSQSAYYIASVSDEIYVNPQGGIDFRGLASQTMFFKNAMQKLGVDMQIVKVGTFKSAVEPFTNDKMSEPNRQQMDALLGSMYSHLLTNIGASREIPVDSLHRIADELLIRNAQDAVDLGLADGLKYKDELLSSLMEKLNIEATKDIKSISIAKYKPAKTNFGTSRDRIAILYANGEIVSGEGNEEIIGSETISRELRKLRQDDRIKAVVFRINSPGGSALASEIIWREVQLLKEVKPVMVSMSDVAASGGYYIAAAADSIFAQPNTITGSIGVFGTVPNLQELWNDKLGITFDGVKTGKFADMLSGNFDRPMTAEEQRYLQIEVERIYNTFLTRVADGRKIDKSNVDSIGQGRVWTGLQALENGLVDRVGNLEDAIDAAALKAEVSDYQIVRYPTIKQPFDAFLSTGTDKIRSWYGQVHFGLGFSQLKQIQTIISRSGVQARMPFTVEIY